MFRSEPRRVILRTFIHVRRYASFVHGCLHLIGEERTLFAFFLFFAVAGALTEGATIALIAPLLDTQTGGGSFHGIPFVGAIARHFSSLDPNARVQGIAVAIAVILLLRSALLYSVDVMGTVIPLRIERALSLRSYDALMNVELSYAQERPIGTILNAIQGWPQRVTELLTACGTLLWNSLIVCVYVGMMIAVSWWLTIVAVVFMAAMSVMLRFITSGPLHRAGVLWTSTVNHLNQVTLETITGLKIIKLTTSESQTRNYFLKALDEANLSRQSAAYVTSLSSPLLTCAAGLFICLLLFVSASANAGSTGAWIPVITLFLFLLFRLLGPVSAMNVARNRIITQIDAFRMLTGFYKEALSRQQPNGTIQAGLLERSISCEKLSFSYSGTSIPALENVDLFVERGKMYAVVGPSGAGKSTLIGLLTRLYDPTHGRITIDGTDLRDIDIVSWRRKVAVVTQDMFSFNDTVARNIALACPNASMERIVEAAKLAVADEFINRMPNGYQSILGDSGIRLSAGQQQRISIARAIITNPEVLILDEATSSLDTFTETAIQAAIEKLSQDRTLIVIAHRLSTVRHADEVIVIDGGRIVEKGSYNDLLLRQGTFSRMVKSQQLDRRPEDLVAEGQS